VQPQSPTKNQSIQLAEDELFARSLAVFSDNDDTKLVQELFRIQQDEELARQLQNAETESELAHYYSGARAQRRRPRNHPVEQPQRQVAPRRNSDDTDSSSSSSDILSVEGPDIVDSLEKSISSIGAEVSSSWTSVSTKLGDWWKSVTAEPPKSTEETTSLLEEEQLVRRKKAKKDVQPVLKINTA